MDLLPENAATDTSLPPGQAWLSIRALTTSSQAKDKGLLETALPDPHSSIHLLPSCSLEGVMPLG